MYYPTGKPNNEKLDFWDKIKYLFSNPKIFFEKIKKEKGIKDALLTYLIVKVFVVSISLFPFINKIPNMGYNYFPFIGYLSYLPGLLTGASSNYFGGYGFISILGTLGFGLIITFIYSGIIHAIIKIAKGQGDFSDTYKVYAYSIIPYLLFSIIPLLGFLSIIYSLILMTRGISITHKISKGKATLVILTPVFIIIGILLFLVLPIFRYGFG